MKRLLLATTLVLIMAACCRTENHQPTGTAADGPEWLFLGKGQINLSTKADTIGTFCLTLVTDRSLMASVQDTVFAQEVTIGPDSLLNIGLGAMEAGFYEVRYADRHFSIGVRPDEVVSVPDAKEDFDAFWDSTLSELSGIPLEAKWTPMPENSNDIRESFKVSFKSLGGAEAGGIVCIPVAEGKYPVHIQYMGYGADVYPFDPSANPDRIDFLVSVRGQGIFRESEGRWIDRGLASKEEFYYRGAFADVKRAVDFAASLEKADTQKLIAYGESQGGAFTVVSAALDSRIKAIAPAVPFMGDFPDYGSIVWWPVHEVLEAADAEGIPHEAIYDLLSYFDVKNFAPRVKCPAYMSFGLQDPTCPPHTNFAIYNNLGSTEKHFLCVPTCGHSMWREEAWPPVRTEFFNEVLGLAEPSQPTSIQKN
ncbi:MAG: acetylxylan esterase [Bacteroidales bacterium]|nr:acetylxylan esterase [Bacteroidales bacterium]